MGPTTRGLRRPVSLIGTAVLIASAAVASVFPKPAETVVPRFSAADSLDTIEAIRNAGANNSAASENDAPKEKESDKNSAAVDSLTRTPLRLLDNALSRAVGAPARSRQTSSQIIPGLHLAIRTESAGELHEALYNPWPDPRLRLVQLAPPYAVSGPGNFEVRLAYVTGSITRSLFEAGQEAGLSDPLITKLAEIFGWDIDFALDVRAGDSFGVIYEEKYWLGRKIGEGPILAAEFSNQGQVYRAIGFQDEDGKIGYYTPTGRNMKRTFLRTPVKFSQVSSRFSKSRYHPILKLWRAHTGVDYVAPTGTPVRATASGRIASLGWNGGYGNTIVIEHGGAYSTLYAHLSRYRTGLAAGDRVEQGDIVGYVGKTGLATGPHLHYEFRVNGQHKNPLTFHFPDGDPVAPSARDEFLHAARESVAQLELIDGRHLASR